MKGPTPWTIYLVIFGPFMAAEFRAWFGWLHKTIRHAAIFMIPYEYRERYEEEWQSNLEDVPGEVGKFLYSLGLLQASLGIRAAATPLGSSIKRGTDIIVAATALWLVAPTFALIWLAIKASSPGPVFIHATHLSPGTQRRKGDLEFRTFERLPNGGYRRSAVGTFLQKHDLDKLPTLVSVLKGDATLDWSFSQLFRR